MKNIWFIVLGLVIGFFTFIIFTNDLDTPTEKKNPTITHNNPFSKPITTPEHTTPMQENTKYSNIVPEITTQKFTDTEDTEVESIYKEEMQENFKEDSQQKIFRTVPIDMSKAQEVKMKIKAKEKGGIVKAKVAIAHDMLTYAQAKKKGRQTHFITHILAKVSNRIVYDASTSQFLSKNPLLKFQFEGKKGEKLTVIYTQITGEVFYASKKIK